jgi:hypothetical protein
MLASCCQNAFEYPLAFPVLARRLLFHRLRVEHFPCACPHCFVFPLDRQDKVYLESHGGLKLRECIVKLAGASIACTSAAVVDVFASAADLDTQQVHLTFTNRAADLALGGGI